MGLNSFLEVVSFDEYTQMSKDEKKEFEHHFVVESNAIEGIPEKHHSFEWAEWNHHHKALSYIIDNYDTIKLDSEEILEIDYKLMNKLRDDAGTYRQRKICMHSIITKEGTKYRRFEGGIWYSQVKRGIKLYVQEANLLNEQSSREEVFATHKLFETIHPFSDGNGRGGRILLNLSSLKTRNEFMIVKNSEKKHYYDMLRDYKETFKKEHPKFHFYKDKEVPYISQAMLNYIAMQF